MQESLPWISGAFGLLGALIGALAAILTVWIQSRYQDRRAALTQAAELALLDYKLRMESAPPGSRFAPASVFIAYQVGVMKLIERRRFTPKTYRALTLQYDKLEEAAFELAEERAAKAKTQIAVKEAEGVKPATSR